jgi:hypothetical protein
MKYDYTDGTLRVFKQDNTEVRVVAAEDRFKHGRISIIEFENGDIEVRDEFGVILFPDLMTITTPGDGEEATLADVGIEHEFDLGSAQDITDWQTDYPQCICVKTPKIGIPQQGVNKSMLRHKPVYDASRNSIWLLYSNMINLSHLIRVDLTNDKTFRYNIRLTAPDALMEPSRLMVVGGKLLIGYDQSVSDSDGMVNGQYGWIEEYNPNGGIFTLLWSGSLGNNSGGWGDPVFIPAGKGVINGKVIWPVNGIVGSRCIVGNVPLTQDSNDWGESRLSETPTSNMSFFHSELLNTDDVRAVMIGAVNAGNETNNVMHYWLLGNAADPSSALHSQMAMKNYNYSYRGSVILDPTGINSLGINSSDLLSFAFPRDQVSNPKRLSMFIGANTEHINGRYLSTGLVLSQGMGSDSADDIIPIVINNEIYFATLRNGRVYCINPDYDEIAEAAHTRGKIFKEVGRFPITDTANKHFSKNIIGIGNCIWIFPYKIGGESTAPIVRFYI